MRLGVGAALVGGEWVRGDVEVEDGLVARVGVGDGRGSAVAVAGLVDAQVNGYAGVDLADAEADGYVRAGRALLEAGTTAYQPTFVTAAQERILAALAALPAATAGGPRILGAHLEGPFLAPTRMGAHDPRFRVDPDVARLRELLAGGRVARVTLAPELPGALALVGELRARGIVVSLGHTEASAVAAHAAFDRGARVVTHLYNAMPAGTAREPTIVAAALAREDVAVELIADGHHVAADTMLAAWRAAGGRLALVSDAVAAAGLGPGEYGFGGRTVTAAADGSVRGPEGQLAGSKIALLDAVRHLHALGVPLERALHAATAVPARTCGRPELADLAPGTPADVVVLGDDLAVSRVLVGGR